MAWREADCIICGARFGWMYTGGVPRNVCSDNCRKKRKSNWDKAYRLRNLDGLREKRRAKYWMNPAVARARTREWAKKNPERKRAQDREYQQINKEKIAEYNREYRKRNQEKCALWSSRKRARKNNAFVEDVHRDKLMEMYGGKCGICGEPIPDDVDYFHPLYMNVDHIVPLSKGGEHSYANCQPAHASCNIQKKDRVDGWQNIKPILEEPSAG